MRKAIIIISISVLFSSCGLKPGIIAFTEQKKEDIVATPMIKDFLKSYPNPAIVVKAPGVGQQATQAEQNIYIYHVIERELLRSGFEVKDRGLFNEVVRQASGLNYEQIRDLTGVDLILELTLVDNKRFSTNRYYTQRGEIRNSSITIHRYGAVVDFKLIIVETNNHVASYSFYYVPCQDLIDKNGVSSEINCYCTHAYKDLPRKDYPHLDYCEIREIGTADTYEAVELNVMEELVRDGVRKMINEIRQ